MGSIGFALGPDGTLRPMMGGGRGRGGGGGVVGPDLGMGMGMSSIDILSAMGMDPMAMLGALMAGSGGRPGMQIGDAMLGLENLSYEQLLHMFGDGTNNRPMKEEDIDKLTTTTFCPPDGGDKAAANGGAAAATGTATAAVAAVLCDESNDQTCSVCLDEFSSGDRLMTLPCKHRFHKPCIKTWLKTNGVCPVCRIDMLADDKDDER